MKDPAITITRPESTSLRGVAPARYDGTPGTGYDFRRWLTPEVEAALVRHATASAPVALVETPFYRSIRLRREGAK